ncbi:xanthine dehydrogenase family protein molybdopterin-binding subunit [Gymnodinialimonas sp. 2305UL16-5]|uniref:xanthine dehydrogenase family protein molybdopterin-binding subunit n=1 Tax=Gymnodinialimonas mytili TaxID=3126503 RepID=UPI0030A4CB65
MIRRPTDLIGAALPDAEAPLRLRGEACYVADIPLVDPLHLAFLRSPIACGYLVDIRAEAALALPGVAAVHTGVDVAHLGDLSINEVLPLSCNPPYDILAKDSVFGVGQPIAAVLATTAHAAADGVEALEVEITEASMPEARRVAAQRWQSGNVEQAFSDAAYIVDAQIHHARVAPSPLEGRAIAVMPEEDQVTIWYSTQTPHRTRSELARILGVDADRLRVIAPDVGGAFGMKGSLYPEEVFAVWAAIRHHRPVRWIASRSEDFASATHGRGLTCHGRLAMNGDGRFLAVQARISAPVGAWIPNSGLVPAWNAARILPGPYDVPRLDLETEAVQVPLAPVGIYRGAGRPEAACLMERLVDKAARVSGMDPLDIRRRNLVPKNALPMRTPTGNLLDSGDYTGALDKVTNSASYVDFVKRRDAHRSNGQIAGIGLAVYLEPSGEGFETACVTWNGDGSVRIASGSSSQGHGRATAYAQIAAEILEVPFEKIEVFYGDTATCPAGIGAVASRATSIGGSAVYRACEQLRARHLEGEHLPLTEDVNYVTEGQAWGYGVYLLSIHIDSDTGEIDVSDVVALDDAGRLVNPSFAEGQVRGGFAQGVGAALMEQVRYDDDGQLLTGSLMDYALPRASDIPALLLHTTENPSPFNVLGAKGIGEAGTIGAPAAILNGVLDALAPFGIDEIDMPLTPCRIWTALQRAKEKTQ